MAVTGETTTTAPATPARASAGGGETLLQVQHLKTYFPILGGIFRRTVGYVQAVDDISFDIKRGETFGLVGESGCGKTTTGRTILRLNKATAGKVIFDGKDVFALSPRDLKKTRADMQIIFQDPYSSLNPRMPCASNASCCKATCRAPSIRRPAAASARAAPSPSTGAPPRSRPSG